MAFAAVASGAFAQQTEQVDPRGFVLSPYGGTKPKIDNSQSASVMPLDTTVEYGWLAHAIRRFDTVRIDPTVPRAFPKSSPTEPTTIFRGVGQVFAPYALYPTYYPSVYNATSGLIPFDDPEATDVDYISQFQGAGAFSVDSIRFFVYKNLANGAVTSTPGKFIVWRVSSSVNFLSTSYKSTGINLSRQDPKLQGFLDYENKPFEKEISPEELEATAEQDPNNPDSYRLLPTTIPFDPPLQADDKEAIIAMYVNDDAVPITQTSQETDEYQRVIGYLEYRTGDIGDSNNVLSGPLDATNAGKSFGVVLYSYDNGTTVADTIHSAFDHLFYTLKQGNNPPTTAVVARARMDLNMAFFGSVTLSSGVKYYFGKDASAQGFGAVTPNPVREHAIVPFSLTERANVKIDLYNAAGEHVKSLLDTRYIPGNYSIDLSATDLQSGTYLVRMTAGDKAYSTKINVVK
jgi:hypothetical protein